MSAEIIAALIAAGYRIENMTEVWGHGWWDETPYRWMKGEGSTLDFGEPCATEAEAWADAMLDDEHHAKRAA